MKIKISNNSDYLITINGEEKDDKTIRKSIIVAIPVGNKRCRFLGIKRDQNYRSYHWDFRNGESGGIVYLKDFENQYINISIIPSRLKHSKVFINDYINDASHSKLVDFYYKKLR